MNCTARPSKQVTLYTQSSIKYAQLSHQGSCRALSRDVFNAWVCVADLGNGGEVFFDGLRFLNPQACYAYIHWRNSDPPSHPENPTDGYDEFSHDGKLLLHYRALYEKERPDDALDDKEFDSMELEPAGEVPKGRGGVRRSTRLKKRTKGINPEAAAALAELEEEIQRTGPSRGPRSKHKAPVKRMDLIRNDEETQNMLLDVLAEADETWLFCNNCQKWRRSRADPNIPSPWFCELNPDRKQGDDLFAYLECGLSGMPRARFRRSCRALRWIVCATKSRIISMPSRAVVLHWINAQKRSLKRILLDSGRFLENTTVPT